ncbi:hybrid sensor histidine kinase/response regulator [Sulfuriflexus mobilis]|uniref:hybrid sensor histidine kinase/response regulator n=1 Tax=Sulfuriflexus mobilis TaxID=1811807 RepID=UPI001E56D7C1|nr:hybrid sensor histidine kinase/response regulator [Sulfuriflexus mobilis]
MLDLFRQEASIHTRTLTDGLLSLERSADNDAIETLMRAAHSIKGAARMVGIDAIVKISHSMEDYFVAVQKGELRITGEHIDTLLLAVDTIVDISNSNIDNINDPGVNAICDSINVIAVNTTHDLIPPEQEGPSAVQMNNGFHDLFKTDARGLYKKIHGLLGDRKVEDIDTHVLTEIHQALHMINGGAKLAGQHILAALGKSIDQYLLACIEGRSNLSEETFNSLKDLLNTLLKWIEEGQDEDLSKVDSSIQKLTQETANTVSTRKTAKKTDPQSAHRSNTQPLQPDHSIRISTRRMNRLVGLASENVVESRWIRAHADAMLIYKRRQSVIISAFDGLRNHLDEANVPEHIYELFNDIQRRSNDARAYLNTRLTELEEFDRRVSGLAERLNHEVLQTRMRPFSDCTQGFKRMVRDLSRDMGKRINFRIIGGNTQVDREILSRIEAPLNHILRNAIDHGIESPRDRIQNGKDEVASITIEAAHNMGMLAISIEDDGNGVNIEALREKIVERSMLTAEMALNLNDTELLDFLYLPGFSTRTAVTEISGRGVGLDVVHNTIQEMRGQIRTRSTPGKGMRIQLMLPLTLSVIRSLLLEIGEQAYAMPLVRIDSIHTLHSSEIETIDGKQFFLLNNTHIGLVDAAQVLETHSQPHNTEIFSVLVIGDRQTCYGLVVDRFLGERDLAVHILDPRLGKIRDISAATLLENGSPALIIDADDMLRSIELLISGERLNKIEHEYATTNQRKAILVVDDSITVREVERKLLESRGYKVDVAVDGMDGWNTVQNAHYDLVISDIDMPRMNGIEFVTTIKNNSTYKELPVMIVSYKDRQEDRDAGLQAGADYYLTKGSFHDDSLIEAVIDLIGEA